MRPVKIIQFGHETLRGQARAVVLAEIENPEIMAVINELKIALPDNGIGLAAPQINHPLRIFLADLSKYEWSNESVDITVCINPEVTRYSDQVEVDWEGCLSAPGIWGKVPRPSVISVVYYTEQGERVTAELAGIAARVFQHELDHLNGVLFIDRMTDLQTLITDEEFEKIRHLNRG